MTPTSIPEDEVWTGGRRVGIEPPEGHEGSVAPVEAVLDLIEEPDVGASQRFNVRVELDEGDLTKLADGEPVWISFLSGVVPFQVHVGRPVDVER